jgi:hypothetical protein
MPIKPEPILLAAERWLELLPRNGETRSRAIFASTARYGDLTTTQYESAYDWIKAAGLLNNLSAAGPASHRVFVAAIETSEAPWLQNADEFEGDPGLLPEDVIAAATALKVDLEVASNYVHSAWGKVDLALREEVGSAGERALVDLLEGYTDAKVDHVSLWNDGFGYDVALRLDDFVAHIEVKSTLRQQRLSIHLSRNEFRTAGRDSAWMLVALRLDRDDYAIRSSATIPTAWLNTQVPSDSGDYGSWESCRLDVPTASLTPGLSTLTPLFGDNVSELGEVLSWPSTQ